MSIRALNIVLAAPIRPPAVKLTAVILANALSEPTGKLNPSLAFIAKRLVQTRRAAQRNVRALINAGLVSVVSNATGGAPGSTPNYHLNLAAFETLTGDAHVTRQSRAMAETGDTHALRTGDAHVPRKNDDGGHPRSGQVTPVSETGDADVTQTVLNRIEPVGCDQLSLIATASPTLSRAPTRARQTTVPKTPSAQIIATYHDVLPELPRVRLPDAKDRQKHIAGFWRWVMTSLREGGTRRATTTAEGIDYVRRFFERARDNNFVMGRTRRSPEHEGWQATFDYLISERGRLQVIERTEA